jgi:magnesium transporter
MTRKIFHRTGKSVASAPGTLHYSGPPRSEPLGFDIMDYSEAGLDERKPDAVDAGFPLRDTDTTSWLNVTGLHHVNELARLGEHFGLHPLVMEDIVSTRQRPKLEDYGDYIYIVCRMVDYDEKSRQVRSEQVSLILTQNTVISFQEVAGDVFGPVRERIRVGRGRIRRAGASYLAYALLDAVVDNYFVVLEKLSDEIEGIEEQMLEDARPELLEKVHALKREMILLRRSVWPLREVLAGLTRTESPLIDEGVVVFVRDVLDHVVQVVEVIESFRDILGGLQDLYLSSVSNRMNEVMKVLTIAATIFVPLTFVAGIYGMNFDFMPELHWKYSYYVFWAVILVLGGGMVGYFKRRGWL